MYKVIGVLMILTGGYFVWLGAFKVLTLGVVIGNPLLAITGIVLVMAALIWSGLGVGAMRWVVRETGETVREVHE